MEDFQDLIDQWDSIREFAEELGVSPNTAAGWYRRNSIPSKYWDELLEVVARKRLRVRVAAVDLVRLATRAA